MSAVPAPASRRIPAAALAQLRGQGGAVLWQGDQLATPALPGCSCGFADLDAELPGGGWPASGLTELLLREAGSGEMRLLAPALARLAAAPRELVWVAPPYPPYAPALHALGLPLERLIWVQPASEADAAWAAEQVLRSGAPARCCGGAARPCRPPCAACTWRRKAAARRCSRCGRGLMQQQSSPAPLRLALEPAAGAHLRVHLFKRRGPSLARPLLLALPPAGASAGARAAIRRHSFAGRRRCCGWPCTCPGCRLKRSAQRVVTPSSAARLQHWRRGTGMPRAA